MKKNITAIVLAGGRSSRMQYRDKGLMLFHDKPMVEHVVSRLKGQVDEILISANQNLGIYGRYSERVLTDDASDFPGPLAGICEGLKAMQTDFLLVVPCDGPMLPLDLAGRLYNQLQHNEAYLAVVHDGQYKQPTYNMVHRNMLNNAQQFLQSGERKLGLWLKDNNALLVDFSDQPKAFANLNSEKELKEFQTLVE